MSWLWALQLTDFCVFCWRKTDTVTFLLFLIFGDPEPWDFGREMFLIHCICVSCHWGDCHEKTLDNSHDKQKYFDNSLSLDAAEEESFETGTEEDPLFSVENSGKDSNVLRLESKLIWPELCFRGKINSQALSLGFSLLSRVCFLLLTVTHVLHCRIMRVTLKWWGRKDQLSHENALHTSFFFPSASMSSFTRTNLTHLRTSLSS